VWRLDGVLWRVQSGAMRRLAVVSDYSELVAALRARAEALDVSNLTLDEVTGLPSGYSGKVLGRSQILGRLSLGLLLDALGLRLVVIEDPEVFARIAPRLERRRKNGAHRQLGPAGGQQR
jgi:hypothetical protein